MARCPFAHWKPLPENSTQPIIKPTQFILHSAVDHPGRTDLGRYFDNPGVGVESHFWVYLDGTIDQYMSTDVRADANSGANRRPDGTGAVSVETEDEGNPDERPWTAAQVKSLVRLGLWLHETHDIPTRQCRTEDDPGIGYHTLFGAPSKWTSVRGKTCPGRARIKQFPSILAEIRRQDIPVDAVLLVHPTTGTPDTLAALNAIFDRPDQKVALVCNASAAKAALRAGKRVYAIGGPAADMVAGDRDLKGAARLDTSEKVLAQARKGW